MKIAVLTTQTPHHAFFVREIQTAFHNVVAFCETATGTKPPFETRHPFEEDREHYECQRWFGGKEATVADFVPTHRVSSLNDPDAIVAIERERPDLVFVFGTGILKLPIIAIFRNRIFNLHGGDPEQYRGLDTHLWAIFHRDFAGLVTTLHRLEVGLDAGDIIVQGDIPRNPNMPIYALRAANTEVCVKLATGAIDMVARDGDVSSRRQRHVGRYYSAMPANLKSVCQARFNTYIKKLSHEPQ